MLLLPEPMLARAGPLPTGKGWRYELKLDGFRALVCTHGSRLRVRSRRGWDMTTRVPELSECLPANVQLDGELIAWGKDGNPDFHRLGRRMLHGDASIPVTYMAFDVLALDGEPTLRLPYVERHALLEELVVEGPPALLEVVASFEDGPGIMGRSRGARARGSGCKARTSAVPAGTANVGQDEEPRDGSVPRGAYGRAAAPFQTLRPQHHSGVRTLAQPSATRSDRVVDSAARPCWNRLTNAYEKGDYPCR